MVVRIDRQGEVLNWCGQCETENGTQIDELLQAELSGHKEYGKTRGPCQGSKKLED